jgi:hypothetical protein
VRAGRAAALRDGALRTMLPGVPDSYRKDPVVNFGKLVDKAWEDKTADEILAAPPSALEGLTPAHDEKLAEFGIKTIGQLADWKYAKRARALADLAETDK